MKEYGCSFFKDQNNFTTIVNSEKGKLLLTGTRERSVGEEARPVVEEFSLNDNCIIETSLQDATKPPYIILGFCPRCLFDIQVEVQPLT